MEPIEYSSEVKDLLKFDREHLWHPYANISDPITVYPVASANGCKITLDSTTPAENTVVEAMSSWWCVIHGYNNPELNRAMFDQIGEVSHVMFGGLTHRPAIDLGQKIIKILDHTKLQKVFLADSGSAAVEVAMKMALQYEFSISNGESNKSKFLTIRNGFHGDTFGAMSVSDPVNCKHSIYKNNVAKNIFVKAPTVITTLPTSDICLENPDLFAETTKWNEGDFSEFKQAIEQEGDQICAVILEPLLQGAGGIRLYHPQFLIEARKICNEYEIPFIMDEVATGFGRTGEIFAFKHCEKYQKLLGVSAANMVDVFPDIICIGKGLTGGYMTLSAVVTTPEIATGLSSPNGPTGGYFMHGPTFMGNPLACSVADKSLEILLRGEWKTQVSNIEHQLFKELYVDITKDEELMAHIVDNVRVCGAVGVVQLKDTIDIPWFQQQFIARNVYIRPFRNLCYIVPPFVISKKELEQVTNAIKEVLKLCLSRKIEDVKI